MSFTQDLAPCCFFSHFCLTSLVTLLSVLTFTVCSLSVFTFLSCYPTSHIFFPFSPTDVQWAFFFFAYICSFPPFLVWAPLLLRSQQGFNPWWRGAICFLPHHNGLLCCCCFLWHSLRHCLSAVVSQRRCFPWDASLIRSLNSRSVDSYWSRN